MMDEITKYFVNTGNDGIHISDNIIYPNQHNLSIKITTYIEKPKL